MSSYIWSHFDRVLAICGILVLAIVSKYGFTDVRDNMFISAIRISDHVVDEPIIMEVVRANKGRWPGGYRVEVRREGAEGLFCSTGEVYREYSQYNDDGTPRQLPDPTKLAWWAWGGDCTEKLKSGTLPEGLYSVRTCHAKRALPFLYRWHCWGNDPVFRVTGMDGPIH
ncbi:MAG: hypothetical protein ACPG4X_20990 [Pikeienuella sp.]